MVFTYKPLFDGILKIPAKFNFFLTLTALAGYPPGGKKSPYHQVHVVREKAPAYHEYADHTGGHIPAEKGSQG